MKHDPSYEKIPSLHPDSPFASFTMNCKATGDDRFALLWHEQLEIKYIVSGCMRVVCDSQVLDVRAGDIVLINPCERHTNLIEKGQTVCYHIVMITLTRETTAPFYDTVFEPYLIGKYKIKNLIRGDAAAERTVKALFDAVSEQGGTDGLFKAYGRFLTLFASLKETYRLDSLLPQDRTGEKLPEAALIFIRHHYADEIGLADIAGACDLTVSHFCRVFKTAVGQSPMSYVNGYRIEKAAFFLANTAVAVNGIANQVGFADNGYFSRCFKRVKGMTPSEYRQIHGGRNEKRSDA